MVQYINADSLENDNQILPRIKNQDGQKFHLLMQQLCLGIPIDSLLAEYPHLKKWVQIAQQYTQIPGDKQCSVNLSHEFNGVYLTEYYDFIVSNKDKILAIDWTIGKLEKFEELKNSWKTQLKLFILHENNKIRYNSISLIYLFANHETTYQCCYSEEQHKINKQKLELTFPVQFNNNKEVSPLGIHENWLKGNITTQEYIDNIPEVEI